MRHVIRITRSYYGPMMRNHSSCALLLRKQQRNNRNTDDVHNPIYKRVSANQRSMSSPAAQDFIFKSPRPPVELPAISLSDHMFSRFEKFGSRTALVDDATGTVYTYSQLEDLARRVGSFMYRNGLRKNDVLCYYGTNNPEFLLLMLGCASIGVILTTANPAYTSVELRRHMEHSGAKTVVTVPPLVPQVREAGMNEIIVIGSAEGCQPFSDLLADDGSCFPTDVSIDPMEDVVFMPYSSGTTGLPKGVMLTHFNIVSNLQQLRCAATTTIDDTNLAVLPFYHVYGMSPVLLGTLQDGGILVTTPGFDPEGFLKAITKHEVTQLHVVPPIVLFLTQHPMVDKCDLSNLHTIISAAAPLGETITNEFAEKRKKHVRQGYGLTETSPVVSLDYPSPITVGSIGPLVPNIDAKIIDPKTGKSLGRNESGELYVRGPQIMKGYHNNDKATKEMIDEDGFLQTGDIGHMRDNDCIVITDRLKELIKYKGLPVAPAELEDLLHKHPAIQDVAVIGLPDDRAGELPRAYVVLKPNVNIQAHDITKYVEENVSDYKKLRGGVEFLKEIPKSASGKILRKILKDKLL